MILALLGKNIDPDKHLRKRDDEVDARFEAVGVKLDEARTTARVAEAAQTARLTWRMRP